MRRELPICDDSIESYAGFRGFPGGLTYNQLPEPRTLLVVGDSTIQSPSDEDIAAGREPLVMRGYILAWAHRIEGKPTVSTVVGGGGGAYGASAAAETATKIREKCQMA